MLVPLLVALASQFADLEPPLARARPATVLPLADLDGDGAAELAVLWRLGPIAVAAVHDGASGEARHRLAPRASLTGPLLVLPDLDADGVAEVGVGGAGVPTFGVHVASGATGRLLAFVTDLRPHARGALGVRPVPDLDGDGVPDLAFAERPSLGLGPGGSPSRGADPAVVVVSLGRERVLGRLRAGSIAEAVAGADYALTPFTPPLERRDLFGAALRAERDQDGDGFPELEIDDPSKPHRDTWILDGRSLAPLARREAESDDFAVDVQTDPLVELGEGERLRQVAGELRLESASTGAVLARTPLPPRTTLRLACRLAHAEPDAPRYAVGLERGRADGTRRGALALLRADLGVAAYRAGEKEHFGAQVVSVGDVDGDGTDDVVATHFGELGDGPHLVDGLLVLSGASGELLTEIELGTPQPCRLALVALGDLDGDGVREVAVGQVGALSMQGSAGRVHVLSPRTGAALRVLRRDDLEAAAERSR